MESWMEHKSILFVTELTLFSSSTEVLSLFSQLTSAFSSEDLDREQILGLYKPIEALKPKPEFVSLGNQILCLIEYRESDSRWKLVLYIMTRIIFLVRSMDLDSESEDSELISLIKQIISLFNCKPDSESELLSLVTQTMRLGSSMESDSKLVSLIRQLVSLKPEPELTPLIEKIISCFRSMNWEPRPFISLCPQVEVKYEHGNFRVTQGQVKENGECCFDTIFIRRWTTKNYFQCRACNGHNHEEYEKAPLEVKHPLHPKHSLQLVLLKQEDVYRTRKCYSCEEDLPDMFYYCSACDYAMHILCVDKPPPLLSIDHSKWHEHALTLFPRHTSLSCDICAMDDSSCPFYICPPCDFVVHQSCLSLPRVLRISRHPHRLSFTPSFDKGDWFCGVCRKRIDNNYGGYSCIKDNCSYAAHSRCATQKNVWDGEDLEGVPEETEEEVKPFVSISHGIIQHFSHQQHHLRLDENICRDYDENKLCQACITPIYFGNFYSCMECDFILHEECANLSRRIYHPIHPHMLNLVTINCDKINFRRGCAACDRLRTGFFYQSGKREWHRYTIHVQCSNIIEPLVHQSHTHPLFLTCKPGDPRRTCCVCKDEYIEETFNCIEGECDFSLCFGCATLPEKVRYKHDKHTLFLTYEEETNTMEYWCEACEKEIKPKGGFYKCDEYCSVTIHIECLIGKDLYLKPGLSLFDARTATYINVLPNNFCKSRPFCFYCKKRCPQKVVLEHSGLIFCSRYCITEKYDLDL